ncbi:hypothetical protein STRIP9103_05742 [Streptomyces ipomoeae 91-03]|uniref:Uncharacterized protein n=1 Tax=Streptomyces ipomoeae 91-03 TaxID=698759 RepID=L1L891_9ACTN|nr:hypothetical protein STRIP9103_05742 [Streptomyces ipomoeae 91-03]
MGIGRVVRSLTGKAFTTSPRSDNGRHECHVSAGPQEFG